MWNKVIKEVQVNRVAGPFSEIPFESYIQSPIGLVPKSGNKTRLIFHLSYYFDGDNFDQKSVNFHTPDELCSVHYHDLDHAILNTLRILKETKGKNSQVYFAKSDCSHTFRILPIFVQHRQFLIIKAQHPVSLKYYYFVDKCLPFGASISCANFQAFQMP